MSPFYSSHKSSYHKFPKYHKISPDTNLCNKTYTNVKYKFFEELVLSVVSRHSGNKLTGDEAAGDEVTDDEAADDEVTGDEDAGDEDAGDEVSGNKAAGVS